MVTRFNLILTGRLQSGHSPEASAAALAALMQISPERAARLLAGRETVIRRDLAEHQLPKYLEALRATGADVRTEAVEADPVAASGASSLAEALSPRQPAVDDGRPSPAAARVPSAAEAGPSGAPPARVGGVLASPRPAAELTMVVEDTMECPACGAAQPKRTLCRECGADMPRVLAAQAEAEREAKAAALAEPAHAGTNSRGIGGGASPYAAPRSSVDETLATDGFATPHALALSLTGRVGRLRYLAYAFPAYLPAVVGGVMGGIIGGVGRSGLGFALPLILGVLITVWLALRAMVLRLHDMNRTGKWVLLMVVVPVFAALTRSPAMLGAFSVLVVLASLALVILPGSAAGNDYGAPPGPNTFWTIVGAALMILLTVVSFVSGGMDAFSGFGASGEELTAEELRQLEEFQRQIEEMQRR